MRLPAVTTLAPEGREAEAKRALLAARSPFVARLVLVSEVRLGASAECFAGLAGRVRLAALGSLVLADSVCGALLRAWGLLSVCEAVLLLLLLVLVLLLGCDGAGRFWLADGRAVCTGWLGACTLGMLWKRI